MVSRRKRQVYKGPVSHLKITIFFFFGRMSVCEFDEVTLSRTVLTCNFNGKIFSRFF